MLSPFVILGPLNGPKLFKRVLPGRPSAGASGRPVFQLNKMSILIGIAAAVAVTRSGNSGGSHDGRAYIGVGLHGRTHLIDFIDRQLASTCAREYSVVFLSRHTFFSF